MKKVTRSLLTLAVSASFLMLSGCAGYKMGSIKPSAYADIKTIAVPTFENRTLEPRVAVIITNTVIKQIQLDGTFKVTDLANADAELRGEINRIERRQLRSALTDTFETTQLMSFLVIRWALHDPVTGEKLDYNQAATIDENNLDTTSGLRVRPGENLGRTIVFVDPNFQTGERNAIPVAAQNAAQQLVSQLTEGW